MVSLLSEIERAKRADTLAEFARNEAAMADRLVTTGRTPLSDGDGALAGGFAQWCAKNKVRHCPARPAVVARFISEIAHQGEETVLATIQAIDLLHDFHGMANPTATAAVRIALESIVKVE